MDDTFRRGPLLLLAGRANRPLASEIGEIIGKSPDGATIAFTSDRDGNREIYLLEVEQLELIRLTDNLVLDGIAAWRPW